MTDFDKKLAGAKEEVLAFQTSKMWTLWLEYANSMKEDFRTKAITAETVEKREYARMSYLAFQHFEQIPFVLVRRVEAISQETAPANS